MFHSQTKGNVINLRTQGSGKQTKASFAVAVSILHTEEFLNSKKGRNTVLILKDFYKPHFALSQLLPFYCFILQKKT